MRLAEEDSSDAGPSTSSARQFPAQPILLPSAHDSVEAYEAAWEYAESASIGLDALFPGKASAFAPDEVCSELICQLTKYYQSDDTRCIPKPSSSENLPIESAFVNLALVHEKKSLSTATNRTHIIILGEAGVGKSIASQWMAYCWSRKENPLWGGPQGQFQAVFWLRLKDLLGQLDSQKFAALLSAYCMPGTGLNQDESYVAKLADWLLAHKDQVLFILDGYDEVADAASGQDRRLKQFLDEVLAYPFVIITSRPYCYSKIGQKPMEFFIHYLNIGFRTEDFPRYLNAYLDEHDQKSFLTNEILAWLDKHPIAKSIARVPLQLGMIAWLWQNSEQQELNNLSDTLTLSTLYQKIIDQKLLKLQSDLKCDSEITRLIEIFLSKLAYQGMTTKSKSKRYRFSMSQILKIISSLNQTRFSPEVFFSQYVSRLGLLKSEKGSMNFQQMDDRIYFCHLTYQEYYCAFQIIFNFANIQENKSYEQEIIDLIAKKKYEQHFERIWWFVAGILGGNWRKLKTELSESTVLNQEIKNKEEIACFKLVTFFNEFQRNLRDVVGGYELNLLVRCTEEAQLEDSLAEIAPEVLDRVQRNFELLRWRIEVFPRVTKSDLKENPFLKRLLLSPYIFAIIGGEDLADNVQINKVGLEAAEILSIIGDLSNSNAAVKYQAIQAFSQLTVLVKSKSESQQNMRVNMLLEHLSKYNDKVIRALGKIGVKSPAYQREMIVNKLLEISASYITLSTAYAFLKLMPSLSDPEQEAMTNKIFTILRGSNREYVCYSSVAAAFIEVEIPATLQKKFTSNFLAYLISEENWINQNDRDLAAKMLSQLATSIPPPQLREVVDKLLVKLNLPEEVLEKDRELLLENSIVISLVLAHLTAVLPKDQQEKIAEKFNKDLTDSHQIIPRRPYHHTRRRDSKVSFSRECIYYLSILASIQLTVIRSEPLNGALIGSLVELIESHWSSIRDYVVADLVCLAKKMTESILKWVVKELLAYLKDSYQGLAVREAVVKILGELRNEIPESQRDMVVNSLLACLQNSNLRDKDSDVQSSAALALGKLAVNMSEHNQKLIVDRLFSYLKNNPSKIFKHSTAAALDQIETTTQDNTQKVILNTLSTLLKFDPYEVFKQSVVTALGQLAPIIPKDQQQMIANSLLQFIQPEAYIPLLTIIGRVNNSDSNLILAGPALCQLAVSMSESQREIILSKYLTYLISCSREALRDSFWNLKNTRVALIAHYVAQAAQYTSKRTQSLVVVSLFLNAFQVKKSSLTKILLEYFDVNELLCLGALVFFHYEARVRRGAFIQIMDLASKSQLDLRPNQLLSFLEFKNASLKEVANFLRLILSICDTPGLSTNLCLLVVYLCFAHQLALTIETKQDGSPCLKVYRQEASEIIALAPTDIETALNNLREVYCHGVDTNKHSKIFPEASMLIRNQRLWGLFRIPTHSSTNRNAFDSLISPPGKEIKITRDQWVVAVGAYKLRGAFNSHAFLLIEGMDEYGRGLFLRYDLAIDRDLAANKTKYHVIQNKVMSLQTLAEREKALTQDILRKKEKRFVSCLASRQTEVAALVKLTEADVGKDMTDLYDSLPNIFPSLYSRVQSGKMKREKMNCLTWILSHLKVALGEEKFQGAFHQLEKGLPIPTQQVKVHNKSPLTWMYRLSR